MSLLEVYLQERINIKEAQQNLPNIVLTNEALEIFSPSQQMFKVVLFTEAKFLLLLLLTEMGVRRESARFRKSGNFGAPAQIGVIWGHFDQIWDNLGVIFGSFSGNFGVIFG